MAKQKPVNKSELKKLKTAYLKGEGSIAVLVKRFKLGGFTAIQSIAKREGWANEKKKLAKDSLKTTKKMILLETVKSVEQSLSSMSKDREKIAQALGQCTAIMAGEISELLKPERGEKRSLSRLEHAFDLGIKMMEKIDRLNADALFLKGYKEFSEVSSLDGLARWVASKYPLIQPNSQRSINALSKVLRDKEMAEVRDKVPYEALDKQMQTTKLIVEECVPMENRETALVILRNHAEDMRKLLR